MHEVKLYPMDLALLEPALGKTELRELRATLDSARGAVGSRTIFHINSTAKGGGVAEMLPSLLGYALSAGFQCRWLVIDGAEDFFRITKRLHNSLHGERGDHSTLGFQEHKIYEATL